MPSNSGNLINFLPYIFLLTATAPLSTESGGTPDFPCSLENAETTCDPRNTFLTCVVTPIGSSVGTCQCTPLSDSVWEDLAKKCVYKANTKCFSDIEAQPCTKFSKCQNNDGAGFKCVCQHEAFADPNGFCRSILNKPCDPTETDLPDCSKFEFLTCDKGSCACQRDTRLDGTLCKAVLDAPCQISGIAPDCSEAAFLKCDAQNFCKCQPSTVNHQGECQSLFDTPCEIFGQAPQCKQDAFLTCNNNTDHKCACANPNSVWDPAQLSCVSTAGSPCSRLSDEQPCPKFSDCENPDGAGLKCTCQENTEIFAGLCKAGMDKPCDSQGLTNPQCVPNKFLVCAAEEEGETEKICKCQNDTVAMQSTECRAVLNKPCKITGQSPDCKSDDFLICDETQNLCKCQSALVEVGGVCVSKLEGLCTQDGSSGRWPGCDDTSFLNCTTDGVCKCVDGHDEFQGKCTAHFGDQCGGLGAACDAQDGHLVCNPVDLRCVCEDNFVHANEQDKGCSGVMGIFPNLFYLITAILVVGTMLKN